MSRQSFFLILCLSVATPFIVFWKKISLRSQDQALRSSISVIDNGFARSVSINSETNHNANAIDTIALIGERNSGTTWMLRELRKCYGDSFRVLNHMTRHKHYFQYNYEKYPYNNTLVVAEFRNPYQWLLAMIEKPRRCTAHRNMDWKTFVTTPWTTARAPSDMKHANSTEPVCQERFRYHEVVSCERYPAPHEYLVFKDKNRPKNQSIPIYELRRDGSGQPYSHVMEMRADKIRNHVLEVREFPFVKGLVIVRYEDLLSHGTADLHSKVFEATGIRPHCAVTPPQPDRPQREMPDGFKAWVDEHVDWDAEALIGYSKL